VSHRIDVNAMRRSSDLIDSIAIFVWANYLMLNLSDPVFPEPAAV
jgi:hypothetical protein